MTEEDRKQAKYWIPKDLDAGSFKIYGVNGWDVIFIAALSIGIPMIAVAYLPIEIPPIGLIVLFACGLLLSSVIYAQTPDDEQIVTWVRTYWASIRRQSEIVNESRENETGRSTSTDDWIAPDRKSLWEIKERTQDVTQVKRVYPDDNVIERNDGAYYSMVRISGVNSAMLSESGKKSMTNSLAATLNDNEYPFQIYVTTEEFTFREHREHYESRQTDPDIRTNPILDATLKSYREEVLQETAAQGTKRRAYYIVIPVTKADLTLHGGEDRVWDRLMVKLQDVPVINTLISTTGPTEQERHTAQVDELSRRVEEIARSLQNISGIDTQRVSAETAVTLLNEYWTGKPYTRESPFVNTTTESGTVGQPLRREPVMASYKTDTSVDEDDGDGG